jgi:hypothetical protein
MTWKNGRCLISKTKIQATPVNHHTIKHHNGNGFGVDFCIKYRSDESFPPQLMFIQAHTADGAVEIFRDLKPYALIDHVAELDTPVAAKPHGME